jgi:hypothetical protein
MIPFDKIANDLLSALGLKADACNTEEEACKKALLFDSKSTTYPVYFFNTDTSGVKPYEEFFTEGEILDTEKFINLGIIKNSKKRNIQEIDEIFSRIKTLFTSQVITKSEIVEILKEYLPNFQHIEKGKGLDQKM